MKEVQFTPAQHAAIDIARRGEDACVAGVRRLMDADVCRIEIAPAAAEAEGA